MPNANKINSFISEISQQIYKMYEKVAIITPIWLTAKCYFTRISNAWYWTTVPNMNKFTTFFSEISQLTLKIYEQIDIIS